VLYATNTQVVRCDTGTGRIVWAVDAAGLDVQPANKRAGVNRDTRAKKRTGTKKRGKAPVGGKDNLNPTLVLTADMVYCSTTDSVRAHRLSDGTVAWTGRNTQNYMKMSDLFVADGLVWTGLSTGHDPATGAVKRRLKQRMTKPMGHDRCYRNRITETYLINSKTGGADFVPLDGKGEFPSPWIRGTCGLGVIPCNGLLYSSPFSCSCCKGTMLTGFKAAYSADRASGQLMKLAPRERLVKGPAYGSAPSRAAASAADWPVYRNSNGRYGRTRETVGTKLRTVWTAKLPSRPTATTVVDDLVYVSARDSHTLYALSRDAGDVMWTYTAGGRIDSPPSYHAGLLLFGCRDGWVHCLAADTGTLVWKFNDLPERRLVAVDEQFESAWPVCGAVMIRDGVAYFAAGRSSFLDGGIVVYGLDPSTGKVIHRRQMSGPYASNGFPIVGRRNTRIEGFKGGIFTSEGDLLYIRHQAFKPDLAPVALSDIKQAHLIASGGFLDDLPQHRTYWTIDTDLSYGPNTGAPGAGPQGDILVIDGDTYYEIRGYLPGRHSTTMVPQNGYTLYSGRSATRASTGGWRANPGLRTVPGFGLWQKRWATQIPLTGRALALAGDTLIAAGAPLRRSFDDGALEQTYAGQSGGVLWLASAKDGSKLADVELPSLPVWDGISVARGMCFISLTNGTVKCME
jgi:outer membrane protein assembly factor BamB